MSIAVAPQQYVHPTIPSGFGLANDLQKAAFEATGSVHGASKVAMVNGGTYADGTPREPDLAIRMRPPRTLDDVRSRLGVRGMIDAEQYRAEYEKGWRTAKRTTEWPSGTTYAFDDGYLDAAAGRIKWHLTYCEDHDNCGEG